MFKYASIDLRNDNEVVLSAMIKAGGAFNFSSKCCRISLEYNKEILFKHFFIAII